ncbi:MAG TPA: FTR1 family protein [Terriglobia bacterium]|nr:FTR1 family protein [Terriglobia bacterium]
MLEGFVITLREGMEAFLIVGFCLAYLRKSGRRHLEKAVYWGIAVSLVLCASAGVLLYRATFNQSYWEAIFSLVAALFVGTLTLHMWRASRRLKKEIQTRLELASAKSGRPAAYLGVFIFTVLMISREGIETSLLLGSLMFQAQARPVLAGGMLGLLAAIGMAFLWAHYGRRINLPRFFQVTALFLLIFVVQLLIYSFHEFAEASLFPNSEYLHRITEPYGPDGRYGKFLTYCLVLIPAGWLLISSTLTRRRNQPRSLAALQSLDSVEKPVLSTTERALHCGKSN